MDYNSYTIEDFALDRDFREWVLQPDDHSDAYWNNWLQEHPERLADIKAAKRILENLSFPYHELSDEDEHLIFNNITSRIDGTNDEVPVRFMPLDSYSSNGTRIWAKLAVAASLVLAMVAAIYSLIKVTENNQLAYTTDFGETREVQLEDGTVVVLNANSKLYVGEFEAENADREVWLDGEAFFNVIHTASDQKFIVHANKVDVNVLGTEFNVFSRGKKSQIDLASGKVVLKNQVTQEDVDMMPGERVTYDTPTEQAVKEEVDPEEVSSWKNNLLIFRRTSLEEISELLKTNYDIDVFFTQGASSEHYFTGTVPADNIDLLLTTISKTFDLEINRKGQTVIIKPNL
ncbi:FecR family protein [Marinoscillum pacificum]|uniref:FecR family protein n=1 Tax=Marinoscillum pacificum TaxID=392723 RepID=UPI002157CA30|nr:FecR domain-containing protein [Marinoscillum pacificum]